MRYNWMTVETAAWAVATLLVLGAYGASRLVGWLN
jgi:hypothetical protein